MGAFWFRARSRLLKRSEFRSRRPERGSTRAEGLLEMVGMEDGAGVLTELDEEFWAVCTVRLLTTVRMPGTWLASEAASARAASLETAPSRVATPFWTEVWICSDVRAASEERRFRRLTAVVESSAAGVPACLQPLTASPRQPARTQPAMGARLGRAEVCFARLWFRMISSGCGSLSRRVRFGLGKPGLGERFGAPRWRTFPCAAWIRLYGRRSVRGLS